jgi:hypothetical protein
VCGLVDLVTVGFKHLRFCRAGPAPPSALLRLVPERRGEPLCSFGPLTMALGSCVITSSQTSSILAGNGQSVITSAETTTLGA